jgi:hypothetical protein
MMVKIWLLKVVITTIKAELSSDWWPIIKGNDHTRSGKCFSKDAKPTCHMRNEHSAIQQTFWFWEARFGILSSHGPRGCKWNLPSRRRQISCQRASSSASPGVTHSIQDPGWSRFGAPQRLPWNPSGWAISTRDLLSFSEAQFWAFHQGFLWGHLQVVWVYHHGFLYVNHRFMCT